MGVHDSSVAQQPAGNADETRNRLLATAERFFAEKGFDGTSVRDITTAAGCNVAAVNYHFGSKENLYREVFRHRLAALRDLRIRRIREAMSGDHPPTLEGVIQAFTMAFLEPLVEPGEGRLLVELWGREMLEPRLPRELFRREMLNPVRDALVGALLAVEPGLGPEAASMAVFSLVSQLVQVVHLAHVGRRHGLTTQDPWNPENLDRMARHIVRFTAGGIRALRSGGNP